MSSKSLLSILSEMPSISIKFQSINKRNSVAKIIKTRDGRRRINQQ